MLLLPGSWLTRDLQQISRGRPGHQHLRKLLFFLHYLCFKTTRRFVEARTHGGLQFTLSVVSEDQRFKEHRDESEDFLCSVPGFLCGFLQLYTMKNSRDPRDLMPSLYKLLKCQKNTGVRSVLVEYNGSNLKCFAR